MTNKEDYWRPNLTVSLTPEQWKKLRDLIPWGVKTQLMQFLIDDLIEMLEVDAEGVIGGILARKIKLEQIMRGGKDEG